MAGESKRVVNGNQYAGVPEYRTKRRTVIRKKIKPKASSVAVLTYVLYFLTVLFAIGMAYIFVEASITRLNWEIHQQITDNEALMMDNEKLRLEISKKKSLDRVESLAEQELGMIKAANIDFMIISENATPQGTLKESLPEEMPEVLSPWETWTGKVMSFLAFLREYYTKG
ncbi:MAG: cell division protein FtsL [Peptococcaceae bacterium]|jgi:cell division protein FtsL|nr:cell division protein FtsL [Peptococcaceae bacterium]